MIKKAGINSNIVVTILYFCQEPAGICGFYTHRANFFLFFYFLETLK